MCCTCPRDVRAADPLCVIHGDPWRVSLARIARDLEHDRAERARQAAAERWGNHDVAR
jgi:hypothetical protein